ncbi:MAG: bifunctional 4-hydroxy-2-oxoglutarate aldolase/2-dehydro-3-deoxy-phosphogluconate aldolase [Treponema sp.]|nr:bifunctional 4-hydroxy-2-oxoglutarate aldolase/2-dehydro-3-deoxy-phosphogluconate aldolase [Treponema sp.]
MHTVLSELGKIGIVPVIKIDDPEKAVPLAKALAEGGIPCTEITFRTEQGEEALRRITGELPDILAGAGTVLTADQADRAIGAGAKFIVSPGLNPKVVTRCMEKGVPVIPGCVSPSDIEKALEFGLEVIKFFPAEQAGGLEYIKAVSAPFPGIRFIPTGGIGAGNIAKYISFEKVLACGGSWMAESGLVSAGNFEKITVLAREAVMSMLGFYAAHTGINSGDNDAAAKAAEFFSGVFGFAPRETAASVFSGGALEFVKTAAAGTHGHIAIGTNSVQKAAAWLERRGVALDYAGAKKDQDGNIFAIYLKEEILGFAVHLLRADR